MHLWIAALIYISAINLITFQVWGADKQAAIAGYRRVPEARLLTLCALGGGPGGFIAAHIFRHKTSKQAFIYKAYAVVAAQVAVICWLIVSL